MTFMPPISWLRERFYLCEAGVLRYAKTIGKARKDQPVGRKQSNGHWTVDVTHEGVRKKLGLHRVVWSMNKGRAVPDDLDVDHRDRNRDHNLPGNLRAVTQRVNQLNKEYRGTGVSPCGKRFRARISVNGIDISLGTHDTRKKANRAYELARKGRHPKVTRDVLRGRPYTQLLVEGSQSYA